MKLELPKEWFERSSEIEGDSDVGVGCHAEHGSALCAEWPQTGVRPAISAIKTRFGEIESLRPEFESWISTSPFEREIERWPNDESKRAWPGQYRDINVALAWQAWQEAAFIHSLPNAD